MLLNPFKNIAFSKVWFEQFNYLFTFFLNNKKTGTYLREKLRLTDFDVNIPIAKLTPNSVHYEVENGTFVMVAYSYDRIANLFKKEFENIFMVFHNFDEKFANKFLPILNLGYDTLTSYSTTADGYVTYSNANWSTCRSATTGSSVVSNGTSSQIAFESRLTTGNYTITRSFFYFDTSSLTNNAIVSNAVISLQGTSNFTGDLSLQQGTQSATLTASDFDSFAGNSYANVSTIADRAYTDITLNAQAITDLNLTGETKYCGRNYTYDYLNSAPTISYRLGCYYSDNTGTTRDPKLVITYTLPSTTRSYVY